MKIKDAKDFGQMLAIRRKRLGYTLAQVSEITGLSASFISDLERGKATAELAKALYIAGILGLDISGEERGS